MQVDFAPALSKLQEMGRGLIAALPSIAVAVMTLGLFWMVSRAVRSVVLRATDRRRRHRNLGLVLGRLTQGAVVVLGVLVAMVIAFPNFSPAQVVELLGVGSIAIGFAFRDVLQNFLAGILLLITEPFRLDDQIVVGDFEGTVVDIQTRATAIRTYDGRRVMIPNAKLFTETVTVNTAYEQRRLEYDIGIGVSDDADEAKRIVLKTLSSMQTVLREPAPDVLVWELGDFAVKLRVRWWIAPPRRHDALDSRDQVLGELKRRLLQAGIDLPYPTQQVLFHDQTEETDRDRTRHREG